MDAWSLQTKKPFKENEGFSIQLDGVSYNVPDREKKIIDNVSLSITPTCTVLLNGTSGSGKTTLLRIIAGILEPDSGGIFINNASLKGVNLNYYRSHIGQSLPEESPFEGSILNNITFGDKNIPQDHIYWALERVGLTQFVKEQPQGLQTILYPEGKQIPSTIAKKIVLARSIVRKPKLLILKDPLDQFKEEEAKEIMSFLSDPSNGWALLVVSANLRWADNCTRIITMENGRIINEK